MKNPLKIAAISAAALFGHQAQAQDGHKAIESDIKKINVYMKGAEVHRKATVSVGGDKTKFALKQLPLDIIQGSIHVEATNGVKVVSSVFESDPDWALFSVKRLAGLRDSLETIAAEKALLNTEIATLNEERAMIVANKSRIGSKEGITVAELKEASDFFRNRLNEIARASLAASAKTTKADFLYNEVNKRYYKIYNQEEKKTGNIYLILASGAAASTELSVRYVVNSAGWAPKYELRSEGISKPIELKYKAELYNDSGEDWEEVKIVLSTANPMQNMAKPSLDPWGLTFVNPYYEQQQFNDNMMKQEKSSSYGDQKRSSSNMNQSQNRGEGQFNTTGMSEDEDISGGGRAADVSFSEIEVSELSVEFEVLEKHSVLADGKPYVVDVNAYKLDGEYSYYCIPKVDKDAFLLAKVTGWESLNLIEGEASVYYSDTYVGKTYISTGSSNDTLSLSLGRDKKVSVTRIKKKDYNSKKLIGTTRKESFAYEIGVRNNNSDTIKIEIIDQVPISQEGEIAVEVEEISGASHDTGTGALKWVLELKPSENKKLVTAFSVKYPKNKEVSLRKSRKVSAPRYKR